jgi:asparagine synthase (glutamine-hydrolysing)
MLHRYLAVISTPDARPEARAALQARVRQALGSWRQILATDGAEAWVLAQPRTRLGGEPVGEHACWIGRRFPWPQATAATQDDEATPPRAYGAYVRIAYDPAARCVRVYRDPTGRIECYHVAVDGGRILFSHLEDVLAFLPGPLRPNWDYLAYHLNNAFIRGAETGLAGVTEVLPGEEVAFGSEGPHAHLRWRPSRIAQQRFQTPEAAARDLRRAAEQAAADWAAQYGTIALDLSGGLDSSIVLGLLRGVARHPDVIAVNFVTPHAEGDERRYAREAAALHGVPLIEQEVSPETSGSLVPFAGRMLRPSMRIYSGGYDVLGQAVTERYSADAFFTGTGGDHVFYAGLGLEAICDYWDDRAPRRDLLGTAYRTALVSGGTVWGALTALVEHRRSPAADLGALLHVDNALLSELGRQADATRFAHPWLRAAIDEAAPAKLKQILMMCTLATHYWRYGRADAAEEVHPLFSEPLLEAALRTPAYWFGSDGYQRGLQRKIFADLLPPSIQRRRSKGANTNHWVKLLTRDLARTRELLLEGQLIARGLLDRQKVEAALSPLRLAACTDFTGLVTCLTTEMWLDQLDRDRPAWRARAAAAG